MQCKSCGAELPDDARFCIECGADLERPASTGATMVLPRRAADGIACNACGSANPSYAIFCVHCGHRMGDPVPSPLPPPVREPVVEMPRSLSQSIPPPVVGRSHRRRGMRSGGEGVIFLLGMAALILLKIPFWPTILIIIGLTAFVGEASRGRYGNALNSALWLFGLAFLFRIPNLFWPGILVLVALSMLLSFGQRVVRRPW